MTPHGNDIGAAPGDVPLGITERLANALAGGAGPAEILDELVAAAGGKAWLFDDDGRELAHSASASGGSGPEIWASLPPELSPPLVVDGERVVAIISAGKRREAVLVLEKPHTVGAPDRAAASYAAAVLSLLMASRRAVVETERRITGDVIADGLRGELQGDDLAHRLQALGYNPAAPVAVLVLDVSEVTDAVLLDDLVWTMDSILSARATNVRTTRLQSRLVALVPAEHAAELGRLLAAEIHRQTPAPGIRARVGVGRGGPQTDIRYSYLSAVFALRSGPEERDFADAAQMGSYAFLLAALPREALAAYVEGCLGPLVRRDEERDSNLLPTVAAFVAAGGRWAAGAEDLGVHRHTLRYRIQQAEEALGRSLSDAEFRFEVWLALKAAEILEE